MVAGMPTRLLARGTAGRINSYLNTMDKNKKAVKNLMNKGLSAHIDNDTVYVDTDDTSLGLSEFEIDFQAQKFDEETPMKATKRLIDSVWTLEYERIGDTKARIIRYSREDPEGYDKEKELPQCTLVEGENRIVTHVLLREKYEPYEWVNKGNCDFVLEVVNPLYIFSYKGD